MSPLIYSLIPKSYTKKSHKSSVEFRDVENFIIELRRRIVDCWNYKLEVDDSPGSGYKIKFDQFEKKFLKKSDFVFYIVNSLSEDAFKSCIERLLKSCKNSEKLANVIILSLNTVHFEELNETSIEFIYFGDDWQTENGNQWNVLENILKKKFNIPSPEETPPTNSLAIPISNTGRKSPSKLKTFFNSLPSRFDSDKRISLFSHKTHEDFVENTASSNQDIRLPNINISEIDSERNEEVSRTLGPRHKVDSSKLSLNSLFKKRSKKARDSGLSLNSSASTGSGSRKSDTLTNRESMSTDGKEITVSSSDHSPVILTAKVEKAVKHKAKIEVFKAKANKVIRSTSCLHSPKEKRSRYHVKDIMNDVVNVSSTIMYASSDIGNQSEIINRKGLTYLMNNRGKSEPPTEACNNTNINTMSNGIIKYYSWNDVSNEEKDQMECNDLEIPSDILQPEFTKNSTESNYKNSESGSCNEIIDNCNMDSVILMNDQLNNDIMSDDEVFHTSFKPSNSAEIFDENQNLMNNYTESSYSTFLPPLITSILNENQNTDSDNNFQSPSEFKAEKTTVKLSLSANKLKDDPMESLDKLIKSIQMSCEEMRAARKSQEFNKDDVGDNFSENDLLNTENIINQSEINETVLNNNYLEEVKEINITNDEYFPKLNFSTIQVGSYREMSPELIAAADSIANSCNSPINLIQQTYRRMIRNPIIVSGIFAATTYAAPIWCSYIPRNVCLSKLFCGTLDYLFYSEIVQSIPNQIISSGRNSASVASKTIKRFLF